ncbi:MAG: TonB-dependent receptor, partial [Gemmatimonadota bacterium]|nr:TonB-dependent receptor [Gemmatimonadota bacterium]
MRGRFVLLFFILSSQSLAAQQPVAADTAKKDSIPTLPDLTVTVGRQEEKILKTPNAIGVVGVRDLQGAQAGLGLDESLANIPGVYVANRYNYNLDQRISIRGFGARANFGLRGVKVLLDGVPQTLPDGQSQLTNVDFGNLERIEVLLGSSSSLYGNASGGVLSMTTQRPGVAPFSQSVRAEGGSFGLFKIGARSMGRSGPASGTLYVSHTNVDGFRQHSATDFTQLNLGGNYLIGTKTDLGLRFGYTNAPEADNPGALTLNELLANPDSAAANNILREAGKDVSQSQLAFTLRQYNDRGHFDAALFGFSRDLKNALATPPPQGPGPTIGTYTEIDRKAGGLRLSGDQRVGTGARGVRLVGGVDLQRMRDDRQSWRADAGVPDTTILNQQETVTEVGPFLQAHWNPVPAVAVSGGVRYDAVTFDVEDEHLSDGTDNSGNRTMSAWSGNIGVALISDPRISPYINLSNSFETPTTTELANQPNSTGGFNSSLDPQRALNGEIGVRGTVGKVTYSATGFMIRVEDAIVQYREVSGRGYFTNAGEVHNDGLEFGLEGRVTPELRLFGNYTYSHFRFEKYRITNGAVVDTLDGNVVPGVPEGFIRLGLRAGPVKGFALDLDHTMATSMYADDRNTQWVDGFGATNDSTAQGLGTGVTNVRISWEGLWGGAWVRPFVGINNLWDRSYVSSLTLNGAFGRVYESAPGRNYYIGGEIGWAARR